MPLAKHFHLMSYMMLKALILVGCKERFLVQDTHVALMDGLTLNCSIKHFLPLAVSSRPLLLILDGHSTHYQPSTVQFAKDNQIIMFCLPPHSTHASQPLDTAVFNPLKRNWNDAVHAFLEKLSQNTISLSY